MDSGLRSISARRPHRQANAWREQETEMMEALFGTGSAVWPAMPAPALGVQPPISFTNRPIAPLGPAVPTLAAGVSAAPPISPQATFPLANNLAALVGAIGFDPTPAVTAPALLMAVALRRGQPQGPSNDQEVEDFIYDAFELLPGTTDVEVRCEGGRVTLTGSVQHKRVKRDVGEIAWAIPVLHDVQNNVAIASRRRARSANREGEPQQGGSPPRKQN
jgi:hypothetical protein